MLSAADTCAAIIEHAPRVHCYTPRPDDPPDVAEARANVLSWVTLAELHQRRTGHIVPYLPEVEAAIRAL
jgi:hypothetical protein